MHLFFWKHTQNTSVTLLLFIKNFYFIYLLRNILLYIYYVIYYYLFIYTNIHLYYDQNYKLNNVYNILVNRLELYMEDYNLTQEDIVYVELSFRKKDKVLLSEFSCDKDQLKHIDNNLILNTNKLINIPISINEDSLGKPLDVEINNGLITNIKIYIDKSFTNASPSRIDNLNKSDLVNFLTIIKEQNVYIRANHKDNINFFDSNYKFYFTRDEKKNLFVLVVKVIYNDSIDKIFFIWYYDK